MNAPKVLLLEHIVGAISARNEDDCKLALKAIAMMLIARLVGHLETWAGSHRCLPQTTRSQKRDA
jgi:hypothetical protein